MRIHRTDASFSSGFAERFPYHLTMMYTLSMARPKREKRSKLARVEKVRLYPTPSQISVLTDILSVCCDLYNAGLAERRGAYELWKRTKPEGFEWPTLGTQLKQLTEVRSKHDWVAEIYQETAAFSLKSLDNAFSAFLSRHAKGEKPGYPRFRAKRRFDTFTYPHGNRCIQVSDKTIKLPSIGQIKYRKSGRDLPKEFGVVKISRQGDKWYACFEHVIEAKAFVPTGKETGVDVGIANFAATCDGTLIPNPKFAAKAKKKVDKLYQAVARCKKRSKRRKQVVARLAKAKQREVRQRVDHAHKLSRMLVNSYDLIAFEDLRVLNMVRSAKGTVEKPGKNVAQKSGLNRSILDAAWRRMMNFTVYKAEEAGKLVVFVNPRNTSRTCQNLKCRYVSSENRATQAEFLCVKCGYADHADTNASKEIYSRARLGLAAAA